MKINLSYTKKLLLSNTAKLVGYLILLIVAGFISLRAGFLDLIENEKWRSPVVWLVISAFILGIIYTKLLESFLKWQDRFQDKTMKQINHSYLGYVGEKFLLDWINELLDERYKRFPNFKIPGTNFDIDLVVVGPKGLFLFEVKNSANPIAFFDTEAFIMDDNYNPISPLPFNPLEEVKRHTNALTNYLELNNYKEIWIHPCLVMVGGKIKIVGKPKIFIAANQKNLNKYINDLPKDSKYTDEFCNEVSKLLSPPQ